MGVRCRISKTKVPSQLSQVVPSFAFAQMTRVLGSKSTHPPLLRSRLASGDVCLYKLVKFYFIRKRSCKNHIFNSHNGRKNLNFFAEKGSLKSSFKHRGPLLLPRLIKVYPSRISFCFKFKGETSLPNENLPVKLSEKILSPTQLF